MPDPDALPPEAADVTTLQQFQDLMPFRVHNLLLVSSLYDSFILAEDGQVSELILRDFLDLNLHHTPGLRRVSTGEEALALIGERGRDFNLIVSSLQVGDMDVQELARRVKEAGLDIPVVLLAYNNRELTQFVRRHDIADVERVFLWSGDERILLAIVKYIEDKRNVAHDCAAIGVQSIIVVEDNVRTYSAFLPAMYTELVNQSQRVLAEGMNVSQKLLRMRARPKVLLCDTFEEAWGYFETYRADILGVISDIEFPRRGKLDAKAGVELARRVRKAGPDIPILLQSSQPQNRRLAKRVGADFLLKGSPVLIKGLLRFMKKSFAWGDFVFRLPGGREVGRASDLRSLEKKLLNLPAESLAFHGERNDFSNWFKARTEFALAEKVRPIQVTEFPDLEDLRKHIITSIREYRRVRDRGVVADFDTDLFDATTALYRVGGGSLGGKARGLAFGNFLLTTHMSQDASAGVRIAVPPALLLATEVFDRFLAENRLRGFAMEEKDDEEIRSRFQKARMPRDVKESLASYLKVIDYPLAVRSSSLLEDSPYYPFAGIYETYMIPNNEAKLSERLRRLTGAIKQVFASAFSEHAKAYLETTPYRLEEEKMGVIIQRIVGSPHGDRFYPDFSGVVRSRNFYPVAPMRPEDGVAAVALGLGRTVAEGGVCLRFCPLYPKHLVQFSSADDAIRNSQRSFYALHMEPGNDNRRPELSVRSFDLETAEQDGVLGPLASTYSSENDSISDGMGRPGARLVTFAPILKHDAFPLADLLSLLTRLGAWGTSSDVEIEFAVNLSTPEGEPAELGFLQMRPQALAEAVEAPDLEQAPEDRLLCRSEKVLGNGRVTDLLDLVVVDHERFDRARSREAAQEMGRLNADLLHAGVPYLLVGVGRWGSNDPWLGIPVTWDQIAGARVIIESGFRDLRVTPSQGTHFFHNLTSCNVGYFTVNPEDGDGVLDWEWLRKQPAVVEGKYFRHVRLDKPITVLMDGKQQQGVILKPE